MPQDTSDMRAHVPPFLLPAAGQMHLDDHDATWWSQNVQSTLASQSLHDHLATSDQEPDQFDMLADNGQGMEFPNSAIASPTSLL